MNPNNSAQMTQILAAGMQEVMGEKDLQTFLKHDHGRSGFQDIGAVQISLELLFGQNSGRGVLLRSGRACFRLLLPGFWAHLGMTNLQYRLNPTPVRIRLGMKALAGVLSELYEKRISFEETDSNWLWRMENCPFCGERKTSGPVCDFAVGVLQEFLSWTSSGRFYLVEEVECISAGGEACAFRVMKKPLD